jgi:hypothetical protein
MKDPVGRASVPASGMPGGNHFQNSIFDAKLVLIDSSSRKAPGMPGVEEVYRQAKEKPQDQAQPGAFGHGEHQGQADQDAGGGHSFAVRAEEGAGEGRVGKAQHQHPQAYQEESKQGADIAKNRPEEKRG